MSFVLFFVGVVVVVRTRVRARKRAWYVNWSPDLIRAEDNGTDEKARIDAVVTRSAEMRTLAEDIAETEVEAFKMVVAEFEST